MSDKELQTLFGRIF